MLFTSIFSLLYILIVRFYCAFINQLLVHIHHVVMGDRCVFIVVFTQVWIKLRKWTHITNIVYSVELLKIKIFHYILHPPPYFCVWVWIEEGLLTLFAWYLLNFILPYALSDNIDNFLLDPKYFFRLS